MEHYTALIQSQYLAHLDIRDDDGGCELQDDVLAGRGRDVRRLGGEVGAAVGRHAELGEGVEQPRPRRGRRVLGY